MGTVLYHIRKFFGGWKRLRKAGKRWSTNPALDGCQQHNRRQFDPCARSVKFWPSVECPNDCRNSRQTVNPTYYVDVLEKLRKRVVRVRKEIGSSTKTTFQATALCASVSTRRNTTWQRCPNPVQSGHGSSRLLSLPEDQGRPERNPFWFDWSHPRRRDEGLCRGPRWSFPGRVPCVAGSLEKVCGCPRKVFRRILNVCNDILNKSIVRKKLHYFSDTPCIYSVWFYADILKKIWCYGRL